MNVIRIVLVVLGLVVGINALASAAVELSWPARPRFPADPAKIVPSSDAAAPGWLEMVSPFRSDLESNSALIAALQTLQSAGERPAADTASRNAEAQARLRQTLSVAPYHADIWLALALLQAQKNPRDPATVEALKMAYFTAPNTEQLMPVRLDTATSFEALADPDLRELVRGDVRLMVTRGPERRPAVTAAYRRASARGKAFLEEAVQSINPALLPALRG